MPIQVVCVECDEGERSLPEWGDALRVYVGGTQVPEPTRCISTGQHGFSGRIDFEALGNSVLSRIAATPHIFGRSVRGPNPEAALMLLAVVSGSCRIDQGNQACKLHSGEWCLYDPRQPFKAAALETRNELLALTLNRPTDAERVGLFDQITTHCCDAKTGMSRIMFATLTEGFNQMNRLGPSSKAALERALSEMIWDAVREHLEAPLPGVHRDVQCARIKSYVERHVADPVLSVDRIAHALGISVRSVHRAFEADPASSVSNYIWTRRLSHCAACLRDPGQLDRSITDICFSFGFNSTSHFSRLYKEQFGMPPSEYRTSFVHGSPAGLAAA